MRKLEHLRQPFFCILDWERKKSLSGIKRAWPKRIARIFFEEKFQNKNAINPRLDRISADLFYTFVDQLQRFSILKVKARRKTVFRCVVSSDKKTSETVIFFQYTKPKYTCAFEKKKKSADFRIHSGQPILFLISVCHHPRTPPTFSSSPFFPFII